MFEKPSNATALAVVESGGVAFAILKNGPSPELLAYSREDLPFEERSKDALRSGLMQALESAGQKALTQYSKAGGPAPVTTCYCVVGAPWTQSFAGSAHSEFEQETMITDEMIGSLAKKALAEQKDIQPANLLEANVSTVLLNGYPTSEPAGKQARSIDVFTLASDCDPAIKRAATDTMAKLFPEAKTVWRSSARATLAAVKQKSPVRSCVVVEVGAEAADLISIREGSLDKRVMIEQGTRQMLSALGGGKPVAETFSMMEMVEKGQSHTDAYEEFRRSIAKTEPYIAQAFSKAFAELSTERALSDELVLIAPPALASWLSRFFARIDFTPFTTTARPFSVRVSTTAGFSGIPPNAVVFDDSSFCVAYNLVNMELSS